MGSALAVQYCSRFELRQHRRQQLEWDAGNFSTGALTNSIRPAHRTHRDLRPFREGGAAVTGGLLWGHSIPLRPRRMPSHVHGVPKSEVSEALRLLEALDAPSEFRAVQIG